MKKSRGFTLIELLIVTVVIATLMAVVFRLAGTGGESTRRARTISRLQKLSNALSGYYAAFGSYPPVPLQGRSRDIYTKVDGSGSLGYGIQGGADQRNEAKLVDSGNIDKKNEIEKQVEAACRAQPVAAGFPYNPKGDEVEVLEALAQEYHTIDKVVSSYGGFNRTSPEWSENNVFMFGLLSFLLPRYQFMLDGEKNLYSKEYPNGPWMSNNRLPYLLNGTRLRAWSSADDSDNAQDALLMGPDNHGKKSSPKPEVKAMLEQLPSQAVCARWMPNFAGIVRSTPVRTVTEFFGVETEDTDYDFGVQSGKWFIISPDGYEGTSAYVNGTKTVQDGWGEDFYYYSPPPYQSYQLWSSGPNKRTFPPWMEPEQKDRQVVNRWIADDIKVGDK